MSENTTPSKEKEKFLKEQDDDKKENGQMIKLLTGIASKNPTLALVMLVIILLFGGGYLGFNMGGASAESKFDTLQLVVVENKATIRELQTSLKILDSLVAECKAINVNLAFVKERLLRIEIKIDNNRKERE